MGICLGIYGIAVSFQSGLSIGGLSIYVVGVASAAARLLLVRLVLRDLRLYTKRCTTQGHTARGQQRVSNNQPRMVGIIGRTLAIGYARMRV